MSALYETASDLTAIRDVDAILAAIMRRARSAAARRHDLPVAQRRGRRSVVHAGHGRCADRGVPQACGSRSAPACSGWSRRPGRRTTPRTTSNDERFLHREFIDTAVEGENIRAILGVPLMVEGTVIGALLAVHRTVRPFPPGEVSLLMSFAAHAAVALENARLFEQDRPRQPAGACAGRRGRGGGRRARPADRRAAARRWRADVAAVLAACCTGRCRCSTSTASRWWATATSRDDLAHAVVRGARVRPQRLRRHAPTRRRTSRCALAGTEHLGTLLVTGLAGELGLADRRTLERGALVTALVLLFRRSVAEAEERVRGELLGDLLDRRDLDDPGCASVPGGSTPTSTGRRGRGRRGDRPRRHRAAQLAARLGGRVRGLAGEHDGRVVLVAPAEDPARGGHASCASGSARSAGRTVGVAATPARAAGIAAALPRGAPVPGHAAHPGPLRRGQRPCRPRPGPAAARPERPRGARRLRRQVVGPVLAYDAQRGTELVATLEAWFAAGGPARRDREAAARAPQHGRPAAGPGRHPARRRLARPGPRPRRAARAAALVRSAPDRQFVTFSRFSGRGTCSTSQTTGGAGAIHIGRCVVGQHMGAASGRLLRSRHDRDPRHVRARPAGRPYRPGHRRRQRHRPGRRAAAGRRTGRTCWCWTATRPAPSRSPPTLGGDHLVADLSDGDVHRRARARHRVHADILVNNAGVQHVARGRGLRPRAVRVHPAADARGAVPAGPRPPPRHVRSRAGAGWCTSPPCTATAPRRTRPPTSRPSTASKVSPR